MMHTHSISHLSMEVDGSGWKWLEVDANALACTVMRHHLLKLPHSKDLCFHAMQLLLELSTDANNRAAIAKAGAVEKLVIQLRSKSAKVQELSAAVLSRLTADEVGGVDNVAKCAAAGGVRPLISLLESSLVQTHSHAAAVIADMTSNSQVHTDAASHRHIWTQVHTRPRSCPRARSPHRRPIRRL